MELCDYEKLSTRYYGKELIDLHDKIGEGISNLCEQFAVYSLERIGGNFIACGGLKVIDSEVDPRLLGNHHSVRVADFACAALSFVNQITLKDGKKANMRIGIHTGEAVVGILGETKPQFSLIGKTLKTSQYICSQAESG